MTSGRTSVLFVCSGNICRSPYAAERARSLLDPDAFEVSSAGTIALVGEPAADTMQDVASDRGVDLSAHRAMDVGTVATPDWVLGMEFQHLVTARRLFPQLPPDRIRLLDHPHEVPDPYGRSRDVYEEVAGQMDDAVERFANGLSQAADNRPLSGPDASTIS